MALQRGLRLRGDSMDSTVAFYLATAIFLLTYVGIMSEKIPRTICSLAGGGLMIYLGFVSQDEALKEFIDFNTLGLLTGMMLLIAVVKRSGFFEAMALWTMKASHGDARVLLVLLSCITGISASLIDSVTAALLIAPMTISLCRMMKITPVPILIGEILMANIGGTALMIGNPPNVMIGSATHLDFNDFMVNLAPAVLITTVFTMIAVILLFHRQLHTEKMSKEYLDSIDVAGEIKDEMILKRSLAVLALTIVGFVLHSMLGLQSATIAMTGGLLAVLVCRVEPAEALREVDLDTLLFFMGLFILVGGMENTGVISALASWGIHLVGGDPEMMTYLILILSGFASAFIDNIPFTATMIPLIQEMQNMLGLTHADYMWWSLALGACFGGNGTIIGASPNVIMVAIAAREGHNISFGKFMLWCFPIMMMTIAVSGVYLYVRYFL